MSLQDPFTSRPWNTPFYFIIVLRIKYEEASSFHQCMLCANILCIFNSWPSSVLPCSFRQAYSAHWQAFPPLSALPAISRTSNFLELFLEPLLSQKPLSRSCLPFQVFSPTLKLCHLSLSCFYYCVIPRSLIYVIIQFAHLLNQSKHYFVFKIPSLYYYQCQLCDVKSFFRLNRRKFFGTCSARPVPLWSAGSTPNQLG